MKRFGQNGKAEEMLGQYIGFKRISNYTYSSFLARQNPVSIALVIWINKQIKTYF